MFGPPFCNELLLDERRSGTSWPACLWPDSHGYGMDNGRDVGTNRRQFDDAAFSCSRIEPADQRYELESVVSPVRRTGLKLSAGRVI